MKKVFFLYFFVLIPILGLSACIFDSDETGVVDWLADQGLPLNYNVQTLTIDSIEPSAAQVYFDSTPSTGIYRAVFGNVSNINHVLALDFAFRDDDFFEEFSEASDDSTAAFIALYPLLSFYSSTTLNYQDSLPFGEELKIKVSWILDKGDGSSFIDSIGDIEDSVWFESLREWGNDDSVMAEVLDSFYVTQVDSDSVAAVILDLPDTLVRLMQKVTDGCHLQLRLSAPEASRIYRVAGPGSDYPPVFRLRVSDTTYKSVSPFRMADIPYINEDCSDCLVMHGGELESLVVDLPKTKILEALSNFYGDDYPYIEGDSMDVRQAVVLAQLSMLRDDSKGTHQLGMPIQMVVSSYIDSEGVDIVKKENYKLNDSLISVSGHPNLIFIDGDSLKLQVTYGLRDFINKASSKDSFKFMMKMGYPMIEPYDSLYANYVDDDGDSVYMFFSHFDYARYEFQKSMESPMKLKLWLASKREVAE